MSLSNNVVVACPTRFDVVYFSMLATVVVFAAVIVVEEAYQNYTDVRPNLPFHCEKEKGKLDDEFSAFVGRAGPPPTPKNKGNPHSDDSKSKDNQNDGVDFGDPEEDEGPEAVGPSLCPLNLLNTLDDVDPEALQSGSKLNFSCWSGQWPASFSALVAPYRAILRYYRCDTPYRAIHFEKI